MELGERMKVALRKVLADYEYEDGYTHISVATDDPEQLISEAVQAIVKIVEDDKKISCNKSYADYAKELQEENARLRSALMEIQEVIAQPLDRISVLTKEDYAEVRGKVLDIARRALKDGE